MRPLRPTPTLLVDTWGFRLVDADGNLLGYQDGILVTDSSGVVTSITPMPGIEKTVTALPDES